MFRPLEMSKVSVLVLGRDLNRVTVALGDSGLVHLVDATKDNEGKMLSGLDIENNVAELEALNSRIDSLLENLGVDLEYDVPSIGELTKEEIAELVNKVEKLYAEKNEEISALVHKRSGLVNLDNTLSDYPMQNLRLDSLRNLAHLYVAVGKMEEEAFLRARQSLGDDAILIANEDSPRKVLVISSRKKRFALDDKLSKFGFIPIDMPSGVDGTIDAARGQVKDEIEELRQELENARLHGLELGDIYGGPLLAARKQLRSLLFLGKGQQFFGKSRQLYRISGWVPTDKVEELREIVNMTTDNTGLVQETSAEDEEAQNPGVQVPVQLSEGDLDRSFHLLVTNFATPNYHEYDPSFFTGITFTLMFGYMFGDIGQGGVLLLIGLFMKLSKKFSERTRDIGLLMALCGFSAVIFGFLYGSCFCFEEVITSPWWISPSPLRSQNIPQLLMVSVGMGIVFLSVSQIINVVNRFRNRQYFQGICDKYGIVGIVFYWGCLYCGLSTYFGRPWALWKTLLILVPLILLGLREPIHNLLTRRRITGEGGSLLDTGLEGAVEMMETLTGYMSGTVSFIRVGAFAISHASLCFVVFAIVHMLLVSTMPANRLWALLVVIIGNVIVTGFEGMVVAIQCIRLEYYEMYGRYFTGGGLAYKPFAAQKEK